MTTWKWNRMYRNRYNTPVEKVEDPTIPARIDTLLGNGLINDWEKNFLTSVKAGYDKYKSLTKGQNDTFVNIEKRYDSAELAKRNAWSATWTAEKAANWAAMIGYYKGTPYYKGAVEKYEKNNAYIPSEKEYVAVCENKYAMKYLKNRAIPAKFKQGAMVVYKRHGNYRLATIVNIGMPNSWTKGSRGYTILPLGQTGMVEVEEKELLYYREGLIDKLQKFSDDDIPF